MAVVSPKALVVCDFTTGDNALHRPLRYSPTRYKSDFDEFEKLFFSLNKRLGGVEIP
jgi:hypothetical protein